LSIGVVSSETVSQPDLEELLARADALMYRSKQEKGVAR
jgi:PleD family two-component response regulator